MEAQWTWLTLDELKADNPYLRLETDVADLERSIETVGLLHPLVVDKEHRLLSGGRRYCALQKLGWEKVPVVIAEADEVHCELISLDENLKRKPLQAMELEGCLRRAQELYDKLNPQKPAFDPLEEEAPRKAADEGANSGDEQEEPQQEEGFVAEAAKSTGLSEGVIKKALKRNILASEKVKEARQEGRLSSAAANEIVKLDKREQDVILPHIGKRPTKDIRKLVKEIKTKGVEEVVENERQNPPAPFELMKMLGLMAQTKRWAGRLLIDDVELTDLHKDQLASDWAALSNMVNEILSDRESAHDEEDEDFIPQQAPSISEISAEL